jgi:cytochrome c-type biogenesis protein
MESANITYVGAFIAGLLSFLSPCVLPLIPSYITYITGFSFAELNDAHPSNKIRRQTVIHSLVFIAGFTFVFVLLGASATFIGSFIRDHVSVVRKVGGVLMILFGAHITGLLPIHLLFGEKRVNIHRKPVGYFGSFLVGLAFAAGWTPCIGPILASILIVASVEETVLHGVGLLVVYSMGLAIPFFISSLAFNHFILTFNRFKKSIRIFEVVTGIFLIIMGVIIFTDTMSKLGRYVTMFFG